MFGNYRGLYEQSIDQFQRELNLAGSPSGMVDDPEARPAQDVHGQSEGGQVEGVKELGAELQGCGLRVRAAAKGGVFDQSHVEIVKARAPESVSSQGSEAALVWPGAARNVNGDGKERGIVVAPAKVVFPNRAAGGEIRRRDLIRPVTAPRAHAGLLNPGINRKRRAAGEGGDVQYLPARGDPRSQGVEKAHTVERQRLDGARREYLCDVKG